MRSLKLTTLLTFIPIFISCSTAEPEALSITKNCGSQLTCESGEICIDDTCTRLCSEDRPCAGSDLCTGGLCNDGFCGDGLQAGQEQCDLGNSNSDTGLCLTNCTLNRCGDGNLYVGHEECDDGNTIDNDGCSSICTLASSSSITSETQSESNETEETPSNPDVDQIDSPETSEEDVTNDDNLEESDAVDSCQRLTDCNGLPIADYHLTLIGDGFCDNDPTLLSFDCAEFNFDDGDCAPESDTTIDVDPISSPMEKPSITLTWDIAPDFYQDEISWELYTYDGLFSLYLGHPSSDPFQQSLLIEKGSYCFSIYDSYGDGGSSGRLLIDGQQWHSWTSQEYTSIHTVCFEVTFQDCPIGTTEDCLGQCVHDAHLAYLGDGECDDGSRSSANFNCAGFHWDFIDCL